jgi:putative DNA methylase
MSLANNGEYRRKLIDVTLPLTQISVASIAYKERKVGTIKNLHKWFAPMPTPALRALIFASLVDDPGEGKDRDDLIEFVKALVPKDGTAPKDDVIREAKQRIKASNPELPVVLDPFSGGGSTIVEALRFGLPSICSDLNPVATLLTRTLGDLLPKVEGAASVSKGSHQERTQDIPFDGLVEDLQHYGALVQSVVEAEVGKYYPTPSGGDPVAWLWARTAPCRNPICDIQVPLLTSPWLSKQKAREATAEAVVRGDRVQFAIYFGQRASAKGTKGAGRAQFSCPKCGTVLKEKDLKAAGQAGKLGLQLVAYCMDTTAGRTFLAAESVPQSLGDIPTPDLDEIEIGIQDSRTIPYGISLHEHLYNPRQLLTLATFADSVATLPDRVMADGGTKEQAIVIATLLGICLSKMAQSNSALVRWRLDSRNGAAKAEPAFGRQAIQMYWDFAECYPFGRSVGSWKAQISAVIGLLASLPKTSFSGRAVQVDARRAGELVDPGTALVLTDPPYFDQINYADLSDYFYLWLRRALREVHSDLFDTIATPKSMELVANHVRHGGSKDVARKYFINGFTEVFRSLQKASRSDLPIIVAYAAKQDEKGGDGSVSSAWVALIEAVLASGLGITGTLPIEATQKTRVVGQGSNALASYIILVCRSREPEEIADKGTFLARLQAELPEAIEALRKAGVSPLDIGQAAIGPGMKIFSGYREVLQPDGTAMSVREALLETDKAATEVIYGEEVEYDATTRFCLQWFRLHAFDTGAYGDADKVLRRTGTAIRDLVAAGVVSNDPRSTVTLLDFGDLPTNYDAAKDERISHWEVAMHLAKRLRSGGIEGAAQLVAAVRSRRDTAISLDRVHRLVHRLFKMSERKYTNTAAMFNELGAAWPDIVTAAQRVARDRYITPEIDDLFSSIEDEEDDDD